MSNPIRKEAESLNIMHFKLVSGDEIVALINRNKDNETIVIVEEPLQLIQVPSEKGDSYYMSFQEWMPLSESRLTAIIRSNIVAYAKCNLDCKEQYLNQVIRLLTPDVKDDIDNDEIVNEVPEGSITIH